MLTLLRHLLSILLLPFMVVVALPNWLLRAYPPGGTIWPLRLAGGLIFLVGFGLFAWCLALFAGVGRGTLAPWDPPREFVAVGPYRHVRNPMITGVLTMLLGEALWFGSAAVGAWSLAFLLINHTYFILLEEPGLERRFGDSYRRYKAAVPRWLPRLRPWSGKT